MTLRRLGFVYLGLYAGLSLLTACVAVQVEPLTRQTFPPRPGAPLPAMLREEPTRSHVKLAHIIATSQNASEDTLRDRILSRARQLGADAVVLGKVDTIESTGLSPRYVSTMPSIGPYYTGGFGGMGTPFYMDPWSYVQASVNSSEWTLYLSGLAIRYTSSE